MLTSKKVLNALSKGHLVKENSDKCLEITIISVATTFLSNNNASRAALSK